MIQVLVADDSAFMRKIISDIFTTEPGFKVIDTARNGKDAVDKVKRLRPDVVTMDVQMPVMDGITALELIMRECPTPVIMISSLTAAGAQATLQALAIGAVDFVAKSDGPISNISNLRSEIIAKCRTAAAASVGKLISLNQNSLPASTGKIPLDTKPGITERIVAIGTSTGGPRALQEVITKLPQHLPAGIVVVQHMPPGFTKSLSERLNSLSALTVKEAQDNDLVSPGTVLIAPGDYHMILERNANKTVVRLNQQPLIGGHRPSVEPLMESVASIYGQRAVGVILTGMGRDGAQGISAIKQSQGYTIAEDQSTAVVFGMPKAAIELGVIDKVLPLPAIAGEIIRAVTK